MRPLDRPTPRGLSDCRFDVRAPLPRQSAGRRLQFVCRPTAEHPADIAIAALAIVFMLALSAGFFD